MANLLTTVSDLGQIASLALTQCTHMFAVNALFMPVACACYTSVCAMPGELEMLHLSFVNMPQLTEESFIAIAQHLPGHCHQCRSRLRDMFGCSRRFQEL